MTEPLDSSEENSDDQPELIAGDPTSKQKGRFSLLFVGLTFVCALVVGVGIG
jgi:hypothetical protein